MKRILPLILFLASACAATSPARRDAAPAPSVSGAASSRMVTFAGGDLTVTLPPGAWNAVSDSFLKGPGNTAVQFDLIVASSPISALITVKSLPAAQVSPVVAADRLSASMAAQGAIVSATECAIEDGSLATFTFQALDAGTRVSGKVVVRRGPKRAFIAVGVWPSDNAAAGVGVGAILGSLAFTERP